MTWKIIVTITTIIMVIIGINIRWGIFQGHALSALWFRMCLNPLPNALMAIELNNEE